MTVRCAQCAWDNYRKSKDLKNSMRLAGTSGGFVWQGTSLCENHFANELLRMEQQLMQAQAKKQAEADLAAKAAAPPADAMQNLREMAGVPATPAT